MEKIKSLADQIREELKNPAAKSITKQEEVKQQKKTKNKQPDFELLARLRAFDSSANKSLVHVRLDEKTSQLLSQFKMASGTDVSKIIAFAVAQLITTEPQFKQIIKNFIQNSDL